MPINHMRCGSARGCGRQVTRRPVDGIAPRWFALCVLFFAAPLLAASFGVSPLLIEFSVGEKTTGVQISNADPEHAVNVQARLFRWQQVDGKDVYTNADGITLSPPLTRIEPGHENLIRLVLTGVPPAQGEASYRLILDELPDASQSKEQSGVSLVIRQSLPVFVASPKMRPAEPEWQEVERVNPEEGGRSGYRVNVRNLGERRLRLSELSLATEDGMMLAQTPGLVGYVLGQSKMSFLIPDLGKETAPPTATVMLKVNNESGKIEIGPLPVKPGT